MEYRRHAERLIARYPHADMSRLDYTVLRDLAMRRPDVTRQALGQALRQGSPNVARRKVTTQLTSCTWHLTDHNILCFSRCNCLVLAVLMPRVRRGEHKMLRSNQPKS